MRIILLLAATTWVMQRKITGITYEKGFLSGFEDAWETKDNEPRKLESENRLEVPLPRGSFSNITETFVKELGPRKIIHLSKSVLVEQSEEFSSRDSYQDSDNPIFKMNSQQGSAQMCFRCDIFLDEIQAEQTFNKIESSDRAKRQVLKKYIIPNSTWNNGVFYTFNTSDNILQNAFKMGVKVWSDNTCINFVELKDAQDKVVVVNQTGCWSTIGQRGGDQLLSLGGCPTEGAAVHEIGHVLGLFHTMSRYDRDAFIEIIMENVHPQYINEFPKINRSYADVYGVSYDYGSIMHYGDVSCSSNNQPTMIAKDPRYQKTMGSGLISFSDLFMINEHHGCNAMCNKSTSAKCANEGFPHPRNCSICICPGGYGGALCDRRPPGCGEDLEATSTNQLLSKRLGRGLRLRDHFDFCNYMITAPEGKKIEVDVLSISRGYDLSGCQRGGVEVKAQEDQKLTGYRFCLTNGSGGPIVSASHRVPVILFNRFGSMQATFSYRYVY